MPRTASLRKGIAAAIAAALVLASPGFECYRLAAQELGGPAGGQGVPGAGPAFAAAGASVAGLDPGAFVAGAASFAGLFDFGPGSGPLPINAPGGRAMARPPVVSGAARLATTLSVQLPARPAGLRRAGFPFLGTSGVGRPDAGTDRKLEPGKASFAGMLRGLALPFKAGGSGAGPEEQSRDGARDFAVHVGAGDGARAGEFFPPGAAAPADGLGASIEPKSSGLLAAGASEAASASSSDGPVSGRREVERPHYLSAYFPALLASIAGGLWGLAHAAAASLQGTAVQTLGVERAKTAAGSGLATAVGAVATAAFVLTAAFAACAALEVASFLVAVARGRGATDEEFHAGLKDALRRLGFDVAQVAVLAGNVPGGGIIKPESRLPRFSFGYTFGSSIFIRPELVRSPWLFRVVLRHELRHFQADRARGPPRRPARSRAGRLWNFVSSELVGRLLEFGGSAFLKTLRLSVLERVLRGARLSLNLPEPNDVLVIDPAHNGLYADAAGLGAFQELSGGKAKLVFDAGPADPEAQAPGQAGPAAARLPESLTDARNGGRFRMILMPGGARLVPPAGVKERKALDFALRRLDDLYLLSKRLLATGTAEWDEKLLSRRQIQRLNALASDRRQGKSEEDKFDQRLSELWRQMAAAYLKDMGVVAAAESFYAALRNKGVLMLPFSASDPGLDVMEKLLRYWEAGDGGKFWVQREDLPEGGHVLVARKLEPRTDLWLKAAAGGKLAVSLTDVDIKSQDPKELAALLKGAGLDDARSAAALAAKTSVSDLVLRAAGYAPEQLEEFRKAGVEVRHAFGADFGENRVFISVPKRSLERMRRYADGEGFELWASRGDLGFHLIESGSLQNVPAAWKLGFTGKGGLIDHLDTGLDAGHPDIAHKNVTVADHTGEGPEDWHGHGPHTTGISSADGSFYKGMAPDADIRMDKIFPARGAGASDGDSMAAFVDGMKAGADVFNVSMGSPGTPGDPLAEFASNLTLRKNSKGHFPIVVASAGNSGPFKTLSQPSVGEHVISVTAAAKSLDDNDVEMARYPGTGFARDTRVSMPRYLFKPQMTALGGDVVARRDIFEKGIASTKSRHAEKSPSDTGDGHRRMSGTSMASPMVAGIALLVKQAVLKTVEAGTEAYEFFMARLPAAVQYILMASAKDLRVPVACQGAGLVDALAAAKLAAASFGRQAGRALRSALSWTGLVAAPAAGGDPWEWLARVQAVRDLESSVYMEAEAAKREVLGARKARPLGNPDAPVEDPAAEGDGGAAEANTAMQKRFAELRKDAAPKLAQALQDPAWLVRFFAAFALMNLQPPQAVDPLLKAAMEDEDGRVRQMAFLALGATPSHAADEFLKQALGDPREDVAVYAAYALVRHGDGSGVGRIIKAIASADKKLRYTAAWLLGQLGRLGGPAAAGALAGRVRDGQERDGIWDMAAASLAEIAAANPRGLTDEAVAGLLAAAGPRDFALTRAISKSFVVMARQPELVGRMKADPLRLPLRDFVLANRSWTNKPGPLGELASLLARILDIPLDAPTPVPNPDGVGVAGVDPNLGPVHLIVEAPGSKVRVREYSDFRGLAPQAAAEAAARFGLDPGELERDEAVLQASLPSVNSLWFNVPDSKVAAFSAALEVRGYKVRRSLPKYRQLRRLELGATSAELGTTDGKSGMKGPRALIVYLDEGGGDSHPAVPAGLLRHRRDFSGEGGADGPASSGGAPGAASAGGFAVGKVLGANGGSEAMAMAGLEWAAGLVEDPLKTPVLVNLGLGGPAAPGSPLNRQIDALALRGIAVIVPAGNEGPHENTVGSPADAPLAISVGEADQLYSSRGAEVGPRVAWVDGGTARSGKPESELQHRPGLGTGLAALNSTAKLAALAGRLAAGLDRLPRGWPLWLKALGQKTADAAPGMKPHEAGRFNEAAARAALEKALENPERLRAEAAALADGAAAKRGKRAGPSSMGSWFRPWAWSASAARGGVARLEQLSAASPDRPAGSAPASEDGPRLTPRQAEDLLAVLSRGTMDQGGRRITPFVFNSGRGDRPFSIKARGAGLEGFLFSKKEIEEEFGEASIVHHVQDYFNYLDALLAPAGTLPRLSRLRAELQELRRKPSGDVEKSRAVNAVLEREVAALQELVPAARPSSWFLTSRIYEIFCLRYNLPGKRAWKGRPPGPAGRKFFADFTDEDLADLKAQGFDTLWTMGIYPIGVRGRKGDAGGSPYSISDHFAVNPDLGTEEELRAFVDRAHRAGLKVIPDFVPNHSSLDARLLDEHPEFYIRREAQGDPRKPPEGFFDYYSRKEGRWLWISHGGYDYYGNRAYWTDTAQFDVSNPEFQRYMAGRLRDFAVRTGVDGFRVDMAYQVTNAYFSRLWGRRMPEEEFLKRLIDAVREAKPAAAFLAEAYDLRGQLSQLGFDAVYDKNDMDKAAGQYGWYDAWMFRDVLRIRQALRDVRYLDWQQGGANGAVFIGNHDEASPRRQELHGGGGVPAPQSGLGKAWKAAALMTLLLPGNLLFYGSQEIGFDKPRPDDLPKSISFTHDDHVDWSSAEPGDTAFFDYALAKAREARESLGRRAEMTLLDAGNGGWVGYTLSPTESSPVQDVLYAVVANPTDAPAEARISRPDLGIDFRATLAPLAARIIRLPMLRAAPAPERLPPSPPSARPASSVPAEQWYDAGAGKLDRQSLQFPQPELPAPDGPAPAAGARVLPAVLSWAVAAAVAAVLGLWGLPLLAAHYGLAAQFAGWVAAVVFSFFPAVQIQENRANMRAVKRGGKESKEASLRLEGVNAWSQVLLILGNLLLFPTFWATGRPALIGNALIGVSGSWLILAQLAKSGRFPRGRLALLTSGIAISLASTSFVLPYSGLVAALGVLATAVFANFTIPQILQNNKYLQALRDGPRAEEARQNLQGNKPLYQAVGMIGNLLLMPVFMVSGRWYNVLGNAIGIVGPLAVLRQLCKAGLFPRGRWRRIAAAVAVYAAWMLGASLLARTGFWRWS